jgi:hypothetical protein
MITIWLSANCSLLFELADTCDIKRIRPRTMVAKREGKELKMS